MKQTGAIISTPPLSALAEDMDDLGQDSEVRRMEVPIQLHGDRIDRALVQMVGEFSRSYLQQLLDDGLVVIGGGVCRKASQRVKAGESISITLRPTLQSQAFQPQDMALNVVYQDDHLLVIDKPAGLVVHPAPGNWSGTLLNGLLAYDQGFATVPRAGIVHRLDKDTSGLMVVARTRLAMDALVHAISEREVSRQYLALGHRQWSGSPMQRVQAPIGRDPRNRLRMAVVDLAASPGKTAQTDIHLLDNSDAACLVRCVLHTGRTHQIRVHMASIGHPLVGDLIYGGKVEAGMQRQALHAFQLGFSHPMTGSPLLFRSSMPADFGDALTPLSLRYNPPDGLKSP